MIPGHIACLRAMRARSYLGEPCSNVPHLGISRAYLPISQRCCGDLLCVPTISARFKPRAALDAPAWECQTSWLDLGHNKQRRRRRIHSLAARRSSGRRRRLKGTALCRHIRSHDRPEQSPNKSPGKTQGRRGTMALATQGLGDHERAVCSGAQTVQENCVQELGNYLQ